MLKVKPEMELSLYCTFQFYRAIKTYLCAFFVFKTKIKEIVRFD